MKFLKLRPTAKTLILYCDGGIGEKKAAAGLGVVIRDEAGEVLALVKRTLPAMTNNEAEYAALVLGLRAIKRFRPKIVLVRLDSEIVVGQMLGRFSVRSKALKEWHSQASRLVRDFRQVDFEHIPRTQNRLADALANEALQEEGKK